MIDTPRAREIPALAEKLALLPLLVRYRRDARSIASDLCAAIERGESVIVWRERVGTPPAGLAWFHPEGTLAMGGYLRLLAVVPGRHRRGVGAALLAAFEDASAARCRHAFLLVSDFNDSAQRFYRRRGYAQVGRLPRLVLAEVDELLFWKSLVRNVDESP